MRGELKCDATRAAQPLFVAGARFRYESPGGSGRLRIESVRAHRGRFLIHVEGVEDVAAAQAFVGATLLARSAEIPLEPGEYLDRDLVSCEVYDASGRRLGTVDRVEHYPASDMLVVEGRLVPMVGAIVRDIDLGRRRIVIDPPAGLLD